MGHEIKIGIEEPIGAAESGRYFSPRVEGARCALCRRLLHATACREIEIDGLPRLVCSECDGA